MGGFKLEYSRLSYALDFGIYGALVLAMGVWLGLLAPPAMRWALAGGVAAGAATWTLLEYVLHRFVLHGVPPFTRWHGEHHRRPLALIGTPTVWSLTWFAAGVFLPLMWVFDRWHAGALTLGIVAGYFVYGIVHHAVHHSRGRSAWLARRRRWHQMHHHGRVAGCYGVTSGFWDVVFATAPAPGPRPVRAEVSGDA